MKTGVITKIGGMHWDIRPAPKWGTIEVRVFDGVSTRAELGASLLWSTASSSIWTAD